VIEGTRASLDRLGLDYVDIVFAHCPDATVPMHEVVRAFNWVVDKGWVRPSSVMHFVGLTGVVCRRSIGRHPSASVSVRTRLVLGNECARIGGPRERSRRRTVR
jgi:aryl-alcohol dehydrogenase-like predicted oxidoreductase